MEKPQSGVAEALELYPAAIHRPPTLDPVHQIRGSGWIAAKFTVYLGPDPPSKDRSRSCHSTIRSKISKGSVLDFLSFSG